MATGGGRYLLWSLFPEDRYGYRKGCTASLIMIWRYSLPCLFPKIGGVCSVYLLPLAGVEEGTDVATHLEHLVSVEP